MERESLGVSFGFLVCVCLARVQPCDATEPTPPPAARVAAAVLGSEPGDRSTVNRPADAGIEFELQLAQGVAPTTDEASGDTVIVLFPSSAPNGIEEELAKGHKLEFVRRLEAETADGRAVLYRIIDGRGAAEVLAALKRDHRVSTAQPNVRYRLPPQAPAPAIASDTKRPPARPRGQGQRNASRANAKANRSVQPSRFAQGVVGDRDGAGVNPAMTTFRSREQSGLVTNRHSALRWPTADEPFVNIGHRNK
jgi:hypothetical protein